MFDDLQLFAQGDGAGEGGEAAAPAESAGDPPVGETSVPAAVGADQPFRAHYDGLLQQAEALRAQFPDFDLSRELEDPLFLRLTAPGVGVSVEDAFYTVHRRQLQQATVQATAQRISNAIRSGAQRPQENGTGSHAPAVTAFDYRSASRQQREALKKAIRAAGARGEKLYPGM